MSKTGSWILGMQEDAYDMSREEFIKVHGMNQVDIWDKIHKEEFEPDYEPDIEGFYGS